MRYDGYYIFCDLVQIDNLQPRSFAYTRWKLRKWLLGVEVPPPETLVSARKEKTMIIYAISTWIYRLFLYTAIAVFVYLKFTKILGIFLFLIEIGFFILWPIGSELAYLSRLGPYIKPNPRLATTLSILCLLVIWFIIPLPHYFDLPAISVTNKEQSIYVPLDSLIDTIFVQRNEKVTPGQKLVQLASPALETEINITETDRDLAQTEIRIASQSEEDRPTLAEKKGNLAEVEEKLKGLYSLRNQLLVSADITGTISQWDANLAPGEAVSKDQVLGKIYDLNSMKVVAFIREEDANDVSIGQQVSFFTLGSLTKLSGKITKIAPERTRILIYPQMASKFGGPIPVEVQGQEAAGTANQLNPSQSNNPLIVEGSFYQVTCIIDTNDYQLRNGEMGEIRVEGRWRSYLMTFFRWFQSLFWREVTV